MNPRLVLLTAALVLIVGCAGPGRSEPTDSTRVPTSVTTQDEVIVPATSSTTTSMPAQATIGNQADLGGLALWKVDPWTLTPLAASPEPVGWWVGPVAASDGMAALVGFDQDGIKWAVWFVDLRTLNVAQLAWGSATAPPSEVYFMDDQVHWIRLVGDISITDRLAIRRFDRDTQEPTAVVETDELGFFPADIAVLRGGAIGAFGVMVGNLPRVTVLDLAEDRVTLDVTLDTDPPIINVSDGSQSGGVVPAWDAARSRLYVPSLYGGYVTTVELDWGTVTTSQFTSKTSFWERLAAGWVPPAFAKGPTSYMTAALTPDGSTLYLTGRVLDWQDPSKPDAYREVPVGLVGINPTTMTEVARSPLPIDTISVSPDGETLLATGWWNDLDGEGWVGRSAGLHLLDANTLEPLLSPEPIGEAPYYHLAFSADGRYAYATEEDLGDSAEEPRTLIIDTETLQVGTAPLLQRFNAGLLSLGLILDP